MKPLQCLTLLLFLLFVKETPLFSQQVLYGENFTYQGTSAPPAGWTAVSLYDNGPSAGAAFWESLPDGTAPSGLFWEDRPPSFFLTGDSGTIAFNSDFLETAGDPFYTPGNCFGTSCAPHAGALESPSYDLTGVSAVAIRFYQHLRTYNARTYLLVSIDGGMTWPDTFFINQDITQRPFGGESPYEDLRTVNITNPAANQQDVRIRFVFEGEFYFWIIDDFEVLNYSQVDLAAVEVVWPRSDQACILSDNEQIELRVQNLSNIPLTGFPLFYQAAGFAQVTETFNDVLGPNEMAVYRFQTPVDLTPDSLNGIAIFAGVGDTSRINNNSTEVELPPCCLTHDSLGGLVIKKQLIVQFKPGTPKMIKDTVRNRYALSVIDSCRCGDLELWEVPIPWMKGSDSSLTIECLRNRVQDEPRVQDDGLNHILDEARLAGPGAGGTFQGPGTAATDTIRVAIPDTGLDFMHDSLSDDFWKNMLELSHPYEPDNDSNCYEFDNWGHNFIDPGEVPADDHSHGTHLAGIIGRDLPLSARLEFMPLKTQAQNGRGTLFDNACAIYYAADKQVDIINLSLGYSGDRNSILDSAIQHAGGVRDILVVTSAGNDTSNVDSVPHWPSGFSMERAYVMSVAAIRSDTFPVESSNFGQGVDISAPGKDVYSTVPGGGFDYKTGTSMAAAAVSRAAVLYLSSHPNATAPETKQFILDTALNVAHLNDFVQRGRVLNLDDRAYDGTVSIADAPNITADLKVFPNPASELVFVEAGFRRGISFRFELLDMVGRVVLRKEDVSQGEKTRIELPVGSLPAGIYICRLLVDNLPAGEGKLIIKR